MPTILDSLVLELSLDPKNFKKGQAEAEQSFKKTGDQAVKTGKTIEESSQKAADGISKIATAALTLFAVLTGAKSLKNFVADVSASDAALGRLSANLKTTPQALSAFSGAIERNGGSAQSAAAGFQSFSNSIQELKATGTTGILPFLLRLQAAGGKQIDLTKSLDEQFVGLADNLAAVAKTDRPLANWFGKQLGFDQDFVNLLLKGGPAVRQMLEDQKKLAPTSADIEASQKLWESLVGLRQTATSIGREIETKLTPYITDLVRQMKEWLEANREWIQTAIVDKIKELGAALPDILAGIKSFATTANSAAKAVGGWTTAVELLFGLWLGAKFLGVLANVRLLASAFGGPWIKAFLAMAALAGFAGSGSDSQSPSESAQGLPLTPRQAWKKYMPTWLGGSPAESGTHNTPLIRRGGNSGRPNDQFTKTNADAVRRAAAALGTSPEDLATVISYETAGKFSPSVMGGKGGNYMGLIQFGPSERAKYGANANQSFAEQVEGPVVRYLKDRGFKPGMDLRDLYSTINAGRPGRYNASDGNGTVSSHVANMAASHTGRARAFLNSGSSAPAPAHNSAFGAGAGIDPMTGRRTIFQQADPNVLGTIRGAPGSVSNINRSSTSSSSSNTSIGTIQINTLATDAPGIAKDLRPAIERNHFALQANYGPS